MADVQQRVQFKKGDCLWSVLDIAGYKPHEIQGHLDRIAEANRTTSKILNDMPNDRILLIPADIAKKLDK
jgi:hypothetical protein